jgi:hypothetical protein
VPERGAYGIRTYLQIGSFFARGLHRGLHHLRLSVPVRPQNRPLRSRSSTLGTDDPFLRYLDAARADDEPVTVEEDAAIAEVEGDRRAGIPTVSFEEVRRRYS